jgi:hypothetical protein
VRRARQYLALLAFRVSTAITLAASPALSCISRYENALAPARDSSPLREISNCVRQDSIGLG